MRIAILGTRGIPASYGGFETFAEHLSTRLVGRGHEVTVYCRSHYVSPRQLEYHGVRLEVLPTIRHKYLDTVAHTFLSALYAIGKRYDAALICNAANAPFVPLLRWTGTPVAINVDGLEHKRRKWNWLGRRYYLLAERLATVLPNVTVTDARVIQEYYQAHYNAPSTMIAYGAEVERRADRAAVRQWRVEPNRYVLYVSRLEPENNAHLVIEGFKRVRTAYKLLIVGDAPYAHDYIKELRQRAGRDRRIIFTGFVFGKDYRALQQNAYCYIHATEVGGTHPALLEAMGYGNCVLTLATPENIEVVGEAGIPYRDEHDLAEHLQRVLRDGSLVSAYRNRAQARVQQYYDWERVVDRYENLFAKMTGRPAPHPDQPVFEQPTAAAYTEIAATAAAGRAPSEK
ncbi:MAG TPA: glycosyltransferase [Pyrinomonadaceae bacterium]|jgi:glycosyltransferase involved in cell wall biosynthesis|nr:glycosyltransferase [Pyrinomonadaceae bacterium]